MKNLIEEHLPLLAKILRQVKHNTINKIRIKKQQKLLKKVGKEALENLDKAFKELEIDWFLSYGTLLGVYRDKGFISHDDDIDIGIFFEKYSNDIEIVLQKYAFKKKHQFEVDNGEFALEETYEYEGIGVDIFYFNKYQDTLVGYGFMHAPNMSWDMTIKKYGGLIVEKFVFPYEGLEKIEFLGSEYLIPKNPKKHLASHYGENFMQKDVKWSSVKMKNRQVLDDKIGVMKQYEP